MIEKGWMDDVIDKLKEIHSITTKVGAIQATPARSGESTQLAPEAVGRALAELMKQNNSTTQAIAVRVTNLASKYPQRAY